MRGNSAPQHTKAELRPGGNFICLLHGLKGCYLALVLNSQYCAPGLRWAPLAAAATMEGAQKVAREPCLWEQDRTAYWPLPSTPPRWEWMLHLVTNLEQSSNCSWSHTLETPEFLSPPFPDPAI